MEELKDSHDRQVALSFMKTIHIPTIADTDWKHVGSTSKEDSSEIFDLNYVVMESKPITGDDNAVLAERIRFLTNISNRFNRARDDAAEVCMALDNSVLIGLYPYDSSEVKKRLENILYQAGGEMMQMQCMLHAERDSGFVIEHDLEEINDMKQLTFQLHSFWEKQQVCAILTRDCTAQASKSPPDNTMYQKFCGGFDQKTFFYCLRAW